MNRIKGLGKVLMGILFLLLPTVVFASSIVQKYDQLLNPLPDNELFCPTAFCDLQQMFLLIIRDFLQLLPIVAVLFIIIGGFQMVISVGNEERLAKAKRTVLWAVLGLVIGILSFSLVSIVQNFLTNL
jgi:prepilin signal peptidase PulO-like enzyme (type II secretory pathway)